MSSKLHRLDGGLWELRVDGDPFLMRPAELNNSSFSSAEYMAEAWPRLVANNVNTVLGGVGWEQIEPKEGHFEFGELDKVIEGARQHGLKVILLWFGSWKNGLSTYVPGWIKTESTRFPRARVQSRPGHPPQINDTLSLFNGNILDADARAFSKLMQHVKEVDHDGTVIMAQVENEVGLRSPADTRDRSDAANKVFNSAVPADLVDKLNAEWDTLKPSLRAGIVGGHVVGKGGLQKGKNWDETFGSSIKTDELFMAYHYARHLDRVAAAGKQAHDIPMFANAWQPSEEAGAAGGGDRPGIYPSGGPVPGMLDIWQLFAPHLEFLSPDIYMGDYETVCREYRHRDQPLFIPEQRRDEFGAIRTWSAIGNHGALGTSPFGIDTDHPSTSPFTAHFALLAKVTPLVLAARQEGRKMYGFHFDRFESGSVDPSPARHITLGEKWKLSINRAHVFGHPGPGYGLVIVLDDHEFLLIGEGFQVTFVPTDPKATFTSILTFDEQDVVEGRLVRRRLLNGDETADAGSTGSVARMPGPDPDYGGFPIAISVPSRTKIASCRPYYLTE